MAEQIRKSDIIQGNPFDEISKEIAAALGQLEKFDNGVKSVAKELSTLTVENKKTVQGIEAITKAEKESEKLMAEKLRNMKLEQQLLVEQEKVKQAQIRTEQQLQKATQAQIKAIQNEANAYKQLERATRDQKNESKRLGAELLKLEADGKKNTKAFKDLEKQYRETTEAAREGDAQLKKLDQTVGDNFRNVGNYEKAIEGLKNSFGTLGAALGVGAVAGGIFTLNKELDKATNTARMFFNESEQGSKTLAQESIKIAKVWGKDTNEVLAAANVLVKEFGVSGDQALKMINDGFNKGADVQGEFISNVKEYSSQLTYAGLSAEESIALITQSQRQGVFSDKGVDAIKEAALSLREMTQPAKDALAAIGMSGEEVLRQIESGEKSYFEVIKEISAKTNEFGQGSQEAGMILADVFKGAGEDAGRFIFSLDTLNLNMDDMADASQGMDAAIGKLTTKFYDFIFGVNESGGVTEKLAGAMNFLADNFDTIVKVVGYALKSFLAYKAAMIGLKALNMAKSFYDTAKAVAQGNMELKDATSNMGKFGGALKGAGIGMAITLFTELAMEIWNIASGANAAAEATAKMQMQLEKSSKAAAARTSKRTEDLQAEFNELQRQRNEEKISESEMLIRKKQLADATRDQVKADIAVVNARKEQYKLELSILEGAGTRADRIALGEKYAGQNFEQVQATLKANIYGTNEALRQYYTELRSVNELTKDAASEVEVYNKGISQGTKNTIDRTAAEKKRIEAEKEALAIEIERSNLEEEAHKRWLERVQAEIDRDREMREMLSNERWGGETIEGDEIKVEPEDFGLPTEEEMQERFKVMEDFQRAITQMLTEQIDKRIEILEQEKQAAASQQNYLEQLAANGNITAQQSIAEQIQLQREAQAEQARLERQKQNIELISSGLSTFNQQISNGKSPGEALASTILSTQTLVGFLKNLQFFAKGTDYAPEGLAVVDEKGAEIITDAQGRIKDIGSNEGARFKYLNKGDKVLTATETSRILNGFESVNNAGKISKSDHAGNTYDLMILNRSLKDVKQAIEHNKVDIDLHMETFAGGMAQIVKSERRGKDIVFNKYRVR